MMEDDKIISENNEPFRKLYKQNQELSDCGGWVENINN